MSKIVIAVNAMIENKEKITDVCQGYNESEIFFRYDGRYKWSLIDRTDEHYILVYYPGSQKLESLASMPDEYWSEFNEMVTYNTKDIGTKESIQTFKDLHTVLVDRRYGMDDVLDSIINTMKF